MQAIVPNRIEVALLGRMSCELQLDLERLVCVLARFHPVQDLTADSRLDAALAMAHVVVGGWPLQAGPAPNVRLVQHLGAGVEGYRRELLPPTAYLCNVYEHEQGVAEHVFMLLLALRRGLLKLDEGLRRGDWGKTPTSNKAPVPELGGMVMGVLGFGRIGRALVAPAKVFGMEVIGIQGHEPTEPPLDGVRYLRGPNRLDEVLREADVIVIACPLTERTRGIIGSRELALMKPAAFLVNVARGAVVDEAALYDALRKRRIAGAGIDTWYQYPKGAERCPPSRHPFHELDNIIMTPHMAGWTTRTACDRARFIAENIEQIARGEAPRNIVWEPAEHER